MKTSVITKQPAIAAGEPVGTRTGKGISLPAVPVLQPQETPEQNDGMQQPLLQLRINGAETPPPDKPFSSQLSISKKAVAPVQARFDPVQRKISGAGRSISQGFILQKKETGNTAAKQTRFDPVQKKSNQTGLPDQLKSGIEQLSGVDISDVKVHYNSSQPAPLQAHAFAQGSDIHVASGQEKHLPHEAWHVVQQKQGRVQATTEVNGVAVNDNDSLEQEADTMGAQAIQKAGLDKTAANTTMPVSNQLHTLPYIKNYMAWPGSLPVYKMLLRSWPVKKKALF